MKLGDSSKRSRASNGSQAAKLGHKDDDEDDEERKATTAISASVVPRQQPFPSSRIYRVSRASGGKDRHSKVYTAKGLRDRRVRLSVSTAIQFYDLQDRLGYDQPSKAIEWLLKAAASAINELPPLDAFPKLGENDGQMVAIENEDDQNNVSQQQQHLATKSGCSSTSETSKGSVLSLSRSESRNKARERARERVVKDKDVVATRRSCNLISSSNSPTSFTELLTGNCTGGNDGSDGAAAAAIAGANSSPSNSSIQRQTPTTDYFTQSGLFTQKTHQLSSNFASQQHHHQSPFGNNSAAPAMGMVPFNIPAATAPEMQQFSFMQDNLMPVSATGDYNLDFTISSGLAGFNRGTLQSNSQSQISHNHIQRISSVGGNNLPFFFNAAAQPATTTASAENQFLTGFDGRLQLCYGDGFQHSDIKGKGKS